MIAIDYEVIHGNGRSLVELTARDDSGQPIHKDRLSLGSSISRGRFCRAVESRAPGTDPAAIEHELLAIADKLRSENDEGTEPAGDQVDGETPPKKSQATLIVDIVVRSGADLFHTPEQDVYATLEIDGHRETWSLRAQAFKHWAARQFYDAHEKSPGSQAIADAVSTLCGMALFGGSEHDVHVRVAGQDGTIYLDLADADWQAIEINASGWRVVSNPPVKFRRPRGALPLPVPVAGGSIAELQPLLNIESGADFILIVAWLLAAFRPVGPFVVLDVKGEQGSAKSTACRALKSLVDPSKGGLRTEPREPKDLVIAAKHARVISFDNVSSLSPWLSDGLCRISTGGGFGTRQLFTDDEEMIFDVQRPILLNGITSYIIRGDLLDRAIQIRLPTIPEDRRLAAREFWTGFDEARPRILGALLDAISCGLRTLDFVKLKRLPRMADFAMWAVACEPACPWPEGGFMDAYMDAVEDANSGVLEGSEVGAAIVRLIKADADWSGTSEGLVDRLTQIVGEPKARAKHWPKTPRAMSNELRRLAPILRRAGIEIAFHRESGGGRRRLIRLCRAAPDATDPAVSASSDLASGAEPTPAWVSDDPSTTDDRIPNSSKSLFPPSQLGADPKQDKTGIVASPSSLSSGIGTGAAENADLRRTKRRTERTIDGVPVDWTPVGWRDRLLQMANACEGTNPERAVELRDQAAALDAGATP